MKVIKKQFEVSPLEYYQKHFQILSVLLDKSLTSKEIEILSHFLLLHQTYPGLPLFDPILQKEVKSTLKLGNNLPTYLKSLVEKNILIQSKNELPSLPSTYIPDPINYGYIIKISNNAHNI